MNNDIEPRMLVERDVIVPARDGVGLATDVYRPARRRAVSGHSRAHPLRQIGAEPLRAHRRRSPQPRSRARGRGLFRARTAMPSSIRIAAAATDPAGAFTKYLSEAEDGYDTLAWLMRQSWCNGRIGDLRPVLRGAHPGGARLPRSAGPGGAVPRLRRLLERLSQRHPPWRRVRSETGDLGLQQRARRRQGPCRQGGARGRRTSAAGSRACRGARAIRRSAPRRNTRTICSSNGRTGCSTISGSSPASMRKAITTATPMCRWSISRAGTTPTRAPRSRTISGCRAAGAPGSG